MPYVTAGKKTPATSISTMRITGRVSRDPHPRYPLSGASWEKQMPALLAAGHRVITYDRRGFGKSSQPATGYNYDTFAADLHKLVTQLELRDFALAGFSMGGGEVARYLGKYGSKGVNKAVFISGVPPFLLKDTGQPGGCGRQCLRRDPEGHRRRSLRVLQRVFQDFYNTDLLLGKRVSEQTVQASWNVAAGASATACLASVPAWHEDFRQDVTRIGVPTLVIQGTRTGFCPLALRDSGPRN